MQASYSLTELCTPISEAVAESLPETYRVRVEISSLTVKGGHCYMELVEKAPATGLPSARIRATCWQNVWTMLSAWFQQEAGRPLAAGMQVLLEVSVNCHPVYGLSLQVTGIDPSYTLGGIALERQRTIARLEQEGVMKMQQLLALPALCRRIAVISSADAAGYGDFVHQLENNPSGFRFHIRLFAALMQGDRAAASMLEALERVYASVSDFDVLVIIRGGGATADLGCFDNYELACACAQFPLPVLTGIGHQRDVAVVDMVAHTSLKTPTAVAAFLLARLAGEQERLDRIMQRLRMLEKQQLALQSARIEQVEARLRSAWRGRLLREEERLRSMEKTLQLLSPETIYRKGYTLTRQEGRTVRSASELQKGSVIETEWLDGSVRSEVL